MRRLSIIFTTLLLILVIAGLALRSQAVVLAVTHWAMATFTELRLELEKPRIDLYKGYFSAQELHLVPRHSEGPALVSVLDFAITTSLSDIAGGHLRNSSLTASQLLIYVSENDDSSDPNPGQWMQLTRWLPAQLDIGQIHLVTVAENTWIFPLKELTAKRQDPDIFKATALADYDGEPLLASLEIKAAQSSGQVESLALKLGFEALETNSHVTLEGVVNGSAESFEYDFSARASYSDIGEFLSGLNKENNALLDGSMEVAARMRGNAKGFVLSNASMTLNNMPSYGFEAAGELHYQRSGGSKIELVAAGEMSSLEYLVDWLDLDVSALGHAQASVNLSGTLEQPVIDNFILITESDDGLAVNISGNIESFDTDPIQRAQNEIRVDAHGPGLYVLERWLGPIPYEPGNWRASWVTRGSSQTISLDSIILETGTEETYTFRVTGVVGEIANTAEIGPASVRGLDLHVSANIPDSADLAALNIPNIPPYHSIEAKLDVQGSGQNIDVSNGEIVVSSGDAQAEISSLAASFIPGAENPGIRDLRADILVSLSDTSVLSQYSERAIPVLGELQMQGKVAQHDSLYALADLTLSVKGDEFSLATQGNISDLANLSGVQLENQLQGVDIQHILSGALEDLQYTKSLGQLNARFKLETDGSKWHIRNLAFNTVGDKNRLDASGSGSINDLMGLTTGNLDAHLSVVDTELLEALTGWRIGPTNVELKVATTAREVDLTITSSTGQTQLNADFIIGYEKTRITDLKAAIYTPHLRLADLGLQVQEQTNDAYVPAEKIQAESTLRLENLLRKSPKFPSDVKIKIDGISGENTNIERLDIHVTGADNRYTLQRFNLVYDDALAELLGIIDLNASPPFLSLAGQAVSLPLSTLNQDLGGPSDIRGTMTARGGISTSGKNTQELIAALDGSLAIALDDTIIQGAAYDVLATDLLAWIYSGAALEKSTYLDCIMARFELQDGVATTDSIYVESERMIATGEGTFDFPRQKLDLTIVPRSRSRTFQIPSKIRLKGDMSNPRPTISPITAAADASAQAILLIPKFAMRLFGIGNNISDEGILPCTATPGN